MDTKPRDDSVSDADSTVVLGHSGVFPRFLRRVLAVLGGLFLTAAAAGGFSLPSARGGPVALLAWGLFIVGLAGTVLIGALLLLGWWQGRPAVLSSSGVRVRSGWKAREIAWADVLRCEVRGAENGRQKLLVAWLNPAHDSQPVWLGDLRRTAVAEEELMATVRRWMND